MKAAIDEGPGCLEVLHLTFARQRQLDARRPPTELDHTLPDPKIWRTAVHEAAHAITAIVLGYDVHSVSVQPGPDSLGRMRPRYPANAPVRDQVLIKLARAEAEKCHQPARLFHELPKLDIYDLPEARLLLAVHHGVLPSASVVTADIDRYRRRAAVLVRRHWGWVERTALLLARRGRLEGYEVRQQRGETTP